MDVVLSGIAGTALLVYAIWRTAAVCLRVNAWLVPAVFLIDFALIIGANVVAPVVLLAWKLWFFYAAARWESARGLFRLPRWPRAPYMRGPRRLRRRRFVEPAPWQRGPLTF